MNESAAPLLLMDVDGVLNPYAAEACPARNREYDLFPDERPVRLALVHGEWLRQLAALYSLVWVSGWGEDANRFIGPVLWLPQYPALIPTRRFFPPAEKFEHVLAVAGDRPLAWVDDDFADGAVRWAATRTAPTLLVDVDPERGLSEPHVAQLAEWAEAGRHRIVRHRTSRPRP